MSRTRKFIGGVSFGYAGQALTTLVGLLITPFLLRRVGQHDYGLWLVGTQIMAYLMLMDFGVVALLPREAAAAAGRQRAAETTDELPRTVGQTTRLVLWQTPVVAVAALATWLFLVPAEWESLRPALGLVLACAVLTFPLRVVHAVLQGLQDLRFLAQVQLTSWLAGMALTVALVAAGAGLYALAAGWVAAQLLPLPFTFRRLRRRFAGALPARLPRLPWAEARRRLSRGGWTSVNQLAVALLFGTEVLVIGKLLGPAAVVPYVFTAKLAGVLANQPQMLMQVAIPALSELRAGAPREHTARVCTALGLLMLMVSGGVVCVVLAVNRGFVEWWVGAGQYGGFMLTSLVLAAMLLRHCNLVVGYVLFAFGGHDRRLALTSLGDGLVTLAALVILTSAFGLVGAGAGMMAGVCLVSLPANLSALAGAGTVTPTELARALAPWFWRFAAVAVCAGLLARAVVPNTLYELAAVSLLTAGVYGALMLPLALREPLGTYVRPRLAPLGLTLSRAFRRAGAPGGVGE
ncbi:MAG TPA: oligosaccharide flippase family protein [Pyrinomonadaceae bacterium]